MGIKNPFAHLDAPAPMFAIGAGAVSIPIDASPKTLASALNRPFTYRRMYTSDFVGANINGIKIFGPPGGLFELSGSHRGYWIQDNPNGDYFPVYDGQFWPIPASGQSLITPNMPLGALNQASGVIDCFGWDYATGIIRASSARQDRTRNPVAKIRYSTNPQGTGIPINVVSDTLITAFAGPGGYPTRVTAAYMEVVGVSLPVTAFTCGLFVKWWTGFSTFVWVPFASQYSASISVPVGQFINLLTCQSVPTNSQSTGATAMPTGRILNGYQNANTNGGTLREELYFRIIGAPSSAATVNIHVDYEMDLMPLPFGFITP